MLLEDETNNIHEDLVALATGPSLWFRKYKRFVINGYRFRIKQYDKNMKNQNSGVCLVNNDKLCWQD